MADWTTRGKTVLITGAARGLGAETARRVAARGANVALVGLEPEELERVAAQCGTNAAWFECDVTDVEALERAVAGTVERFGGIDVVMANAGIATGGMVRSTDPAAFERTIEINLLGVWRTVRAALPHVIERQGYVLVIASLAAAVHGPGHGRVLGEQGRGGGLRGLAASRGEAPRRGRGRRLLQLHRHRHGARRRTPIRRSGASARRPAGPSTRPTRSRRPARASPTASRSAAAGWSCPSWGRALLVLRTALAPLLDRASYDTAAEADAVFMKDVEERGAAAASSPVGAGRNGRGGSRDETPRGGEADRAAEAEPAEPAAG